MKTAPFYNDVAEAPAGGRACWIKAKDGVRLRIAVWDKGSKGTVLIFPGRAEFVEKYGRTASDLAARGYASVAIDWRGQGLSDRLATNRALGHVAKFRDYQMDVAALMRHLAEIDLPQPLFLCSHSMGGAIALRALHDGLAVKRSVFSSPMWGLSIDPVWRPMVQAAATGGTSVGLGEEYAPGTGPENYLRTAKFKGNSLTSSRESWDHMQRLASAHSGLEIGGPSINWLSEALIETRDLARMTPPGRGILCLIGSEEKVVNKRDVLSYVAKWPESVTVIMTGGEHESLMETPLIRKRALDAMDMFYSG